MSRCPLLENVTDVLLELETEVLCFSQTASHLTSFHTVRKYPGIDNSLLKMSADKTYILITGANRGKP